MHSFIDDAVKLRHKSRNPPIKRDLNQSNSGFVLIVIWKQSRVDSVNYDNLQSKISPGHIPTGFDLPRNLWCVLNGVRTPRGRCADSLY